MKTRAFSLCAATSLLVVPCLAAEDIPRTPGGRPDFSGNYDVSFLTPLERDTRFGDRQYFTEEEAEAIADGMAASNARDQEIRDPNRDVIAGRSEDGYRGVGAYNAFWLDRGTAAFKVDGKYRTSVLTDPPNGRFPPRTEAGQARFDTLPPFGYENTGTAWWLENGDDPYDGPESLTLGNRCVFHQGSTMPIGPRAYNNLKTIIQTDTHVVILIEWMHWARIIRLDGEHPPEDYRSYAGDSVGRWEGDTLVIDTTNLLGDWGFHRKGAHVVERLSFLDADNLFYEYTVEDPEFTAPYSGSLPWPRTDAQLYEFACHEGNYSMGNTLRGARYLEHQQAEQQHGR